MNITELLDGEEGFIEECNNHRLIEHGFVNQTPIQIYNKNKHITCIYVRGAVIACRNKDLESVIVKRELDEKPPIPYNIIPKQYSKQETE